MRPTPDRCRHVAQASIPKLFLRMARRAAALTCNARTTGSSFWPSTRAGLHDQLGRTDACPGCVTALAERIIGGRWPSWPRWNAMKLLYTGGNFCAGPTLKRLLLVASELTFMDTPSVTFMGWGTVGQQSPFRTLDTSKEAIKPCRLASYTACPTIRPVAK